MSWTGFKKQVSKANQYVSERVGVAEATKLDEEYNEMERKIEVINELVQDLMDKTREYLQPNPVTRTKMASAKTLSKISGQSAHAMPYPQPEGLLGEAMQKYGKKLGSDTIFGRALEDAGDSYRQMADVKYALEDIVRQNFLEPWTHLQNKELKEVNHHRKKLSGRRLDYDCKKRKQTLPEELHQAEEKLEESKQLAETAMFNMLENDVEQVSQLTALVEAELDYHKQTTEILQALRDKLRVEEQASGRRRANHVPKPALLSMDGGGSIRKSPLHSPSAPFGNGGNSQSNSWGGSGGVSAPVTSGQDPWGQAPPSYNAVSNGMYATPSQSGGGNRPCCKSVFDFEAENEGELALKEGQIVNLISRIDENWYEGSLPNGKSGFFPVTYVEIITPLP